MKWEILADLEPYFMGQARFKNGEYFYL